VVKTEAPDPVAYLDHVSLTHAGPVAPYDDLGLSAAFLRACSAVAASGRGAVRYVRGWGIDDLIEVDTSGHDMEWLSLSRIDPADTRLEADKLSLCTPEAGLRAASGHAQPYDMRIM